MLNEAAGAFIRDGPRRGDRQLPGLSLAGPAISGDIAFVETGHACRGLCGDGRLHALRRGPDGWQVVAMTPTWIS